MIRVIIIRNYLIDQTPGRLLVYNALDPLYICYTLELPFLNNKTNISCIPAGTYQVNKVDKPPRGKHFRLISVPGRSGILIHAGNYASGKSPDTFGCILPGRSLEDINGDYHIDVTASRQVLSELWSLLPDDFVLTII